MTSIDEVDGSTQSGGAMSHSLKQRHGSIYTVTSSGAPLESERDILQRQRRMSRQSRRASQRSSVGSQVVTVPIINNQPDGGTTDATTAEIPDATSIENIAQRSPYQVRFKSRKGEA